MGGGLIIAALASAIQAPAAAAPAEARPAAANAGRADPAGAQKAVEAVVVTAPGSGLQLSVDRRSYDLSKDLQAATGTLADALRNVPSLSVDAQGTVSLRGDPGVTIMLDGKPAPQLNGQGGAAVMSSMPASQIERVEVMANPSSAFSPEGAAGIVNLISKKGRGVGASGSVFAALGSFAQYNVGGNFDYSAGALTISASAFAKKENYSNLSIDDRTQTAGAPARSLNTRLQRNPFHYQSASLKLGYKLDARTDVTASATAGWVQIPSRFYEQYVSEDASGAVVRRLDRTALSPYGARNLNLSAGLRRRLGQEGHELSLDLTFARSDGPSGGHWTNQPVVPAAPVFFEDRFSRTESRQDGLKLSYTRPLPTGGKLGAGYELRRDDNSYDNLVAQGPAPGALTVDPSVTNLFHFHQTVQAAYVTLERPVAGPVTAQLGLRAENVSLNLDQVTSRITDAYDYTRLYPTLHLAYRVDDHRQLTASYSQRLQRPSAGDLNPFLITSGPKDFRQGNSRLMPQLTHSFEAAYEQRQGQTYYLATLFYRDNRRAFSDLVRNLGDGAFLVTRGNLGHSRSGGLELVANGRLAGAVTYNVSGNLAWVEIDAANLGLAGRRSAVSVGGRASVNWQVRPEDLIQVSGSMAARRLTAQGIVTPDPQVNLGWRHRIGQRFSLVVSAMYVTYGNRSVLETPTFSQHSSYRNQMDRQLVVRFDYRFGGGQPRDAAFAYDGG